LVRVISRSTLTQYIASLDGHPDQRAVKAALQAWFHDVRKATWSTSSELKAQFRNASILSAERVVFNIKGNDHRLVTAINYRRQAVFIKWLGTHRAYDKIDARTVQYEG
jgi:mRNA interferase HigB